MSKEVDKLLASPHLAEAKELGLEFGQISGRLVRKCQSLFDIDIDELGMGAMDEDRDDGEELTLEKARDDGEELTLEKARENEKFYGDVMRAVFLVCGGHKGLTVDDAEGEFERWADDKLISIEHEMAAMRGFMVMYLAYRLQFAQVMSPERWKSEEEKSG